MVRTHLSLITSRSWLAALCVATLVAWVGLLGNAWAADATTRDSSTDGQQPDGLPFVMRPGDVLVNAPLGVRKTPAATLVDRLLVSSPLGVMRTPPPLPPQSVALISGALGVLRGRMIGDVTPDVLGVGQNAQPVTVFGRGLNGATAVMLEPSLDTQCQLQHRRGRRAHRCCLQYLRCRRARLATRARARRAGHAWWTRIQAPARS